MSASRTPLAMTGVAAVSIAGLVALGFVFLRRTPRPAELLQQLSVSTDHLNTILYSPDGKYLVAGSATGRAIVWDLPAGHSEFTLELSKNPIIALSASQDGFCMAADAANRLFGWQLGQDKSEAFPKSSAATVAIALRPAKEREIVLGLSDGSLKFLTKSGVLQFDSEHRGSVKTVVFHPNGQSIISGGADGKLIWYDAETRQSHAVVDAHGGEVSALVFSTDGRALASADWDGEIQVRDSESRRIVAKLSQPDAVSGMGWAGGYLVTGSWDHVIRIWSVADQTIVRQIDTGKAIYGLAVSPDNSAMATVSNSDHVDFWKISLP